MTDTLAQSMETPRLYGDRDAACACGNQHQKAGHATSKARHYRDEKRDQGCGKGNHNQQLPPGAARFSHGPFLPRTRT